MKPRKKAVVGLTLSGGGLRAIGHLGAIKALEEHNIRPSVLSGTSAGAIVAAFYAAGYSPEEMFAIIQKTDFFPRSCFRFRPSGLFDPSFLIKIFKEYLPVDDFKSLKIPVYVASTELSAGVTEYFYEGPLHKALLASASIPFVFPAVEEQEKVFIDGGILNNLPIEPIKDKCDFLIGVHMNSIAKGDIRPITIRKTFDRIFHLALSSSVYEKSRHCNLFIDPPGMTRFGMLEKKDAQEVFDLSYNYTMQILED